MGKPTLIVSARHRPLELAVLSISLIASLTSVFNIRPTRTLSAIEAFLPGYAWIWYAGTAAGALAGLVSAFMKIPDCLLLERIGLYILVTFWFGYGFAALTIVGAGGLAGSLYLMGFAVGGIFRISQLHRDIKMLKGEGK